MHGLQTIRRMNADVAFRFGVSTPTSNTVLPKRIRHIVVAEGGKHQGRVMNPVTEDEARGPMMASHQEAVAWCARQANEWGYRI